MGITRNKTPWIIVLLIGSLAVFTTSTVDKIPTTLDGPFKPHTKEFDVRLRNGSEDLPIYDPRVVKRVPAIFPEQISIALSTPDAMWVSWVSGDWQMGPNVTPLDPTSVKSVVVYGTASSDYSNSAQSSAEVYSQLYPFDDTLNYTSGIIHKVRITGLQAKTKYYYRCGDPSLKAMSEEGSFTTLPAPGPSNYCRKNEKLTNRYCNKDFIDYHFCTKFSILS